MSRYPAPALSQTDSNSIGLSSYQRSENRLPPGPAPQRPHHQPPLPQNYLASSVSSNSSPSDNDLSRRTARIHYDQIKNWLYQTPAQQKSSQNRSNPRDKLTRLTRQQFQELSTDVYDELCRRIERGEQDGAEARGGVPFLASRDDFHPKRNQARQKLATLPRSRFKDLASDVFFELERRYPEFAQPDLPPPRPNYSPPQNAKPADPPIRPAAARQATPPLAPAPSASNMRPLNGVVANEVVVPDKSTLVVEPTDEPYDDPAPTLDRPPRNTSAEDQRAGSSAKRGSGSLSSLKYISSANTHARNGSGDSGRGAMRERVGSNGSKVAISDYERRISMMQSKITNLERELNDSLARNSGLSKDAQRVKQLEEEITSWKERCEAQREQLEQVEASMQDERRTKAQELSAASLETQRLKQQVSELNLRMQSSQKPANRGIQSEGAVERLKTEVQELLGELRRMQSRQDELVAEREVDLETIRELEGAVLLNKKRYEAAKTELRNLKRTSALYAPKNFGPTERLALSENGAIVDIHFTAFTTSIDELLQAGRTNVTAEVIGAMRTVIEAVGTVDADVQAFEGEGAGRLGLEGQDELELLKSRINATLSNLITAAKNHAVSFGLSPVSLLDAAASHLSFSLVELVKLVGMRPASAAEIEMAQNYHPGGSKYEDEDEDEGGDTVGMGAYARPNGTLGESARGPGSSPAPLRINKDRTREDAKPSPLALGQEPGRYGRTAGLVTRGRPGPVSPGGGGRQRHGFGDKETGVLGYRAGTQKFEDVRSPSGFDGSNGSDLRDSASGSSSTNQDKVFDSPPRRAAGSGRTGGGVLGLGGGVSKGAASGEGTVGIGMGIGIGLRGRKPGNFGLGISKVEEEEREKLKAYLETQTELIVGSIQALLSSIRGGGGETTTSNVSGSSGTGSGSSSSGMEGHLNQIITVVGAIVDICGDSMMSGGGVGGGGDKEGERILKELGMNCKRLGEMKTDYGIGSSGNGGGSRNGLSISKQGKQAMAAASFGVAKALKELNSHVAASTGVGGAGGNEEDGSSVL